MVSWAAQLARVTLFSSAEFALNEEDWRAVASADTEPDRKSVPGGKAYSGLFGGSQLIVQYSGKRADFVLQPLEDPNSPDIIAIGPWSEVADRFYGSVKKWCAQADRPLLRIAVGGVLLHETANAKHSYEELQPLLKSVSVQPGKMKELVYRVNWPVQSQVVPGLELNRLTTWTAIQVIAKLVQLTGQDLDLAVNSQITHALRFEFDHNSSAERSNNLDASLQVNLMDELIGLAKENAERGEILS